MGRCKKRSKAIGFEASFWGKVIPISKDLSRPSEVQSINERLRIEKPVIFYLIKNAGVARMGGYESFSADEIESTIAINCTAPAVLTAICIPYMTKDSRILNISSASAFQPLPYLNLYASTKVFERHYSRALNVELSFTGITVTAACPSWIDTELLTKELNGKPVKFNGLISAERAAEQALRDAKKGKDMSVCSLHTKFEHLLAKLYPQKIMMRLWLHRAKRYL
jgi:short-subunit dehydrogenase